MPRDAFALHCRPSICMPYAICQGERLVLPGMLHVLQEIKMEGLLQIL